MNSQNVINIAEPSMSPIRVGESFGLLHRSATATRCGVVLCSPWGIDELAARKVLLRLANRLAASGMPTIRFDYPGTADAIDLPADGFESWVHAAMVAADSLKTACGVDKITFVGLGIGAAVALLASARRDDVPGLVLAAPVVGGRRYLREISLGAPVVEEGLGLDASQRHEGVSIGGIVMPPAVAAELKSIDLLAADTGQAKPVLVVRRPSQPQEAALADHLSESGWMVERAEFEGYDVAMNNPTISVMPDRVIDIVTTWVARMAPATGATAIKAEPVRTVMVDTSHGTDEAVSFGPNLFGVLTHPTNRGDMPTVVFLNSGYDHHAGWAYQWAHAARALAASGIPSLRFDMANIGDSPAKPGHPEQVLYGEGQQADIGAALDMLQARGEHAVVLVGRCSGAFAAFQMSARDSRIGGAVVINPFRLIWDPDDDVDVLIRVGPRSMADYRRRATNGKVFSRLMAGDIDVWGVVKGLVIQLGRRIALRIAPLAGSLSKTTRLRRQCHAMFESISRRSAAINIVCSKGDASLEQLAFYFGSDLGRLKLLPGASLTIVPNADHNMTPQAAQDAVTNAIREMALQVSHSARKRSQILEPVPAALGAARA